MRDSRKEKPYASYDQIRRAQRLIKNVPSYKYAERIKNTENKVLRNISLELFYAGETVYLKTK